MPAKITLNIYTKEDKHGIEPDPLLAALDSSLEILRELDDTISGGKCQWRYTYLAIGSGLSVLEGEITENGYALQGKADLERQLESLYINGLASLDASPVIPSGFTTKAVEAALRLGSILFDGIVRIQTAAGDSNKLNVTERLVANAKELLRRGFTDLGSIEGRLETISLAGRPTFNVRDESTGHPVVCSLSLERLEEVKAALGRRILVSGEVTYARRGEPSEVSPVETILLLDDAPVPTVEEIRGLEPAITEGMPSGLYVRQRWHGNR